MGAIQSLMNVIFFLAVAVTVVGSVWLSKKYKERYADFPWKKSALIIAIEVVAWIIFNRLWDWVQANPWIAAIVIIVLVVILLKKKKKEDQIL